jgi:hypothetical protein
MRKILLTFLFLCLGWVSTQAQYVPNDLSYYQKFRKPLASFYFDISAGASMGMGNWGAAPSANLPLLAPFAGEDGMGAGTGYFLSLGFTIPLVFKMDYKNSLYPTIGYGIEAAEHGILNWKSVMPNNPPEATSCFNLSAYLNGGLNYNINNSLVIEAHAKVLFSITSLQPDLLYFSPADRNQEFSIEVPEGTDNELAWTPGFAYSLGIRFSKLRLYAEFYNQQVKRSYGYTYMENGDTKTELFNSDFKVQTLRFGVSYIVDLL